MAIANITCIKSVYAQQTHNKSYDREALLGSCATDKSGLNLAVVSNWVEAIKAREAVLIGFNQICNNLTQYTEVNKNNAIARNMFIEYNSTSAQLESFYTNNLVRDEKRAAEVAQIDWNCKTTKTNEYIDALTAVQEKISGFEMTCRTTKTCLTLNTILQPLKTASAAAKVAFLDVVNCTNDVAFKDLCTQLVDFEVSLSGQEGILIAELELLTQE